LLLKQRARRVVGLALFSVASRHAAWDFRFLAISLLHLLHAARRVVGLATIRRSRAITAILFHVPLTKPLRFPHLRETLRLHFSACVSHNIQ
jgi:hypothetical protein